MLGAHCGWMALLGCALALGCNGTRTGNPAKPEGGELIRSTLERDESPNVGAEQRAQLGTDNQAFAFELYGQVASTASAENLFFSPYSISVALAMSYAGAAAQTAEEMTSALHFALPEPALHAAFNATDLALQGRANEIPAGQENRRGEGMRLAITNALFVEQDLGLNDSFLDVLALNYDTGARALDFSGDPDGSRSEINDWVSDQTNQRIAELLAPGVITRDTATVLVNTIYFKATWLTTFETEATRDAAFHAADGERTVAMMNAASPMLYARGDGYAALKLPYVSPAVSMLIVLPDEGRLANVEAALDPVWLAGLRGQLSTYLVTLAMPKFKFRTELELEDALSALGMEIAFTDRADFSRMSPVPTRIAHVVHEAFVEVNEEGTEAAAATAVIAIPLSAPPPAELVLDRPFIFAIYDEPTGQILFLGRVMDPTAS